LQLSLIFLHASFLAICSSFVARPHSINANPGAGFAKDAANDVWKMTADAPEIIKNMHFMPYHA
jgi:hypothetical protein